tara:strand:- start:2406 stop:2681 length:276 start_codon:yes stop_codon:yes gene_type:complete
MPVKLKWNGTIMKMLFANGHTYVCACIVSAFGIFVERITPDKVAAFGWIIRLRGAPVWSIGTVITVIINCHPSGGFTTTFNKMKFITRSRI